MESVAGPHRGICRDGQFDVAYSRALGHQLGGNRTHLPGTAAQNIVLTAVRIGATSAAGLPLNAGSIQPGQSQALTLQVPGTAGNPGAASSLTVSGTYTGGSFNSTLRVTLP